MTEKKGMGSNTACNCVYTEKQKVNRNHQHSTPPKNRRTKKKKNQQRTTH